MTRSGCTDITGVRLAQGFVYLMAVIDWYRRYVLGWVLSPMLEADFCIETVGQLLMQGGRCEIFNTDQGAQIHHKPIHPALVGL